MAENTIRQKRGTIQSLVGQKFGRLTVLSVSESRKRYLNCLCDCGNLKEVSMSNLGRCIFGCGCLRTEIATARVTKHGGNSKNSDPFKAAMWRVWKGMKSRCNSVNRPDYPHYGGRGITYDPRYSEFNAFFEDFKDSFVPGLEMDRIDVNGNYEKGNIRFITHREQLWNMRKTLKVEFRGENVAVQELAERLQIPFARIRARLRYGWSIEDALSIPKFNRDHVRERNKKKKK